MSLITDQAQEVLDALPAGPWHVEFTSRIIEGQEIGALRAFDGRDVVSPQPETQSFVRANPGILEALALVPDVIDDLIWEVNRLTKEATQAQD